MSSWFPRSAWQAGLPLIFAFTSFSAAGADLMDAWLGARAHDASFAAALATLRAAREKIPQGDALLASQVALSANADQTLQDYQSGNTAAKASAFAHGQQLGATIVWSKPLYDAANSVARDRLHKEAAQAEVQYAGATQDLMLRVARAYFDVLLARENLRLAGAQKAAIGQQLGLATQSYQLGLTSVTDADDAQARFDNTAAAEIAARTDLENKGDIYRQLTGLPPAEVDEVSSTPAYFTADAAPLEALVSQAREANTNVQLFTLGVDIAHRTIDQYRLSASPVVAAVASMGHQFDAGSISGSGGRDLTRNATIGLQLTIPLVDGGSRRSLLRQSLALEDQQVSSLEAARREAERLARAYATSLRDGAQRIASLERARVSGENSVSSNRTGREVGVRTTIDVLNAEQNYFQTLYNLSAARYDQLFNRLQLAAVAGALDETALAQVNTAVIKP